jgi:hypothetical protein
LSFITNSVAFVILLAVVLGAGRASQLKRPLVLLWSVPLMLAMLFTACTTLIKLLHYQ